MISVRRATLAVAFLALFTTLNPAPAKAMFWTWHVAAGGVYSRFLTEGRTTQDGTLQYSQLFREKAYQFGGFNLELAVTKYTEGKFGFGAGLDFAYYIPQFPDLRVTVPGQSGDQVQLVKRIDMFQLGFKLNFRALLLPALLDNSLQLTAEVRISVPFVKVGCRNASDADWVTCLQEKGAVAKGGALDLASWGVGGAVGLRWYFGRQMFLDGRMLVNQIWRTAGTEDGFPQTRFEISGLLMMGIELNFLDASESSRTCYRTERRGKCWEDQGRLSL